MICGTNCSVNLYFFQGDDSFDFESRVTVEEALGRSYNEIFDAIWSEYAS